LDELDETLYGTVNTQEQLVYAAGSIGQDIEASAAAGADLNNYNTYTSDGVSFDANEDNVSDIISLMESAASAHVLRSSQALNFYVQIPAGQESGKYSVLFTLDLIQD
jgi:hypothetical protein